MKEEVNWPINYCGQFCLLRKI